MSKKQGAQWKANFLNRIESLNVRDVLEAHLDVIKPLNRRVEELESMLRSVRTQLASMNTSPAHALSYVLPKSTSTNVLLAEIDAALPHKEATLPQGFVGLPRGFRKP